MKKNKKRHKRIKKIIIFFCMDNRVIVTNNFGVIGNTYAPVTIVNPENKAANAAAM